MSSTVLIDSFAKCRLTTLFGKGEYWGCITFSNLLVAIGMASMVLIVLSFVIKKYQEDYNK